MQPNTYKFCLEFRGGIRDQLEMDYAHCAKRSLANLEVEDGPFGAANAAVDYAWNLERDCDTTAGEQPSARLVHSAK